MTYLFIRNGNVAVVFRFDRSNTLRRRRKLRKSTPKEPKTGDQYEEEKHYGVWYDDSCNSRARKDTSKQGGKVRVFVEDCVDFLRLLP